MAGFSGKGAGLRVEIFDRREKIQPVPLAADREI